MDTAAVYYFNSDSRYPSGIEERQMNFCNVTSVKVNGTVVWECSSAGPKFQVGDLLRVNETDSPWCGHIGKVLRVDTDCVPIEYQLDIGRNTIYFVEGNLEVA